MTIFELMKSSASMADIFIAWSNLRGSKDAEIKNAATIWSAIMYLTTSEHSKVLEHIDGLSLTSKAIRGMTGANKRLLWHHTARLAIKFATKAKDAEPRYASVADGIIERANLMLEVSAADAKKSDQYLEIRSEETKSYTPEITAMCYCGFESPEMLTCARSFSGHEVLFEVEMTEEDAKSTSKCFIATACLPSVYCWQLKELRRFRDEVLESTHAGRSFIRIYYKRAPAAASFLKKAAPLRWIVRVGFVTPLAWAVSRIRRSDIRYKR